MIQHTAIPLAAPRRCCARRPLLPPVPSRRRHPSRCASVKVLTVGRRRPSRPRTSSPGEVRPRVESRLGFRVAGKIVQRHAELGQRVQAGPGAGATRSAGLPAGGRCGPRPGRRRRARNRDLAAADFKRFATLQRPELHQRRRTGAPRDHAQGGAGAAGPGAGAARRAGQPGRATPAWWPTWPAWSRRVEAEPGQVVGAGTPVVRMAQDGPRDVVFSVPEDKVAAIRPGSPVRRAPVGRRRAGRRARCAKWRPVPTRSRAPTPSRWRCRPAPSRRWARPPTCSPQALGRAGTPVIKLPTSALRQEGQGSAVWVLDRASMTVRSQPVQIATADGNEAVVAAGLQPGHAGGRPPACTCWRRGRRCASTRSARSAPRRPRRARSRPLRRPRPSSRSQPGEARHERGRRRRGRASTSRAGRWSIRR